MNKHMKGILKVLTLFFTITIAGQNTYLHCGKLIDTKSGKVLTEKTIVCIRIKKFIAVEKWICKSKK